MIAIIAAGAFVGLFVLWVVLPRKFLKNKQAESQGPRRRRRTESGQTGRDHSDT